MPWSGQQDHSLAVCCHQSPLRLRLCNNGRQGPARSDERVESSKQLHDFLKEQGGSFILRPAATLCGSQIEAVLLDDGEITALKRIFFPC